MDKTWRGGPVQKDNEMNSWLNSSHNCRMGLYSIRKQVHAHTGYIYPVAFVWGQVTPQHGACLGELVTISYAESQALFHKGFSWSFSCYIILMKWFVYSQGQGDLSRVTEAASDRAQPSDPMVALLFHVMLPLCRPQLLLAASKSKAAWHLSRAINNGHAQMDTSPSAWLTVMVQKPLFLTRGQGVWWASSHPRLSHFRTDSRHCLSLSLGVSSGEAHLYALDSGKDLWVELKWEEGGGPVHSQMPAKNMDGHLVHLSRFLIKLLWVALCLSCPFDSGTYSHCFVIILCHNIRSLPVVNTHSSWNTCKTGRANPSSGGACL